MFQIVAPDWPRREHFDHYMTNVRCTYSFTVQVDITKLKESVNEKHLKIYPTQLYMLATIVNRFSEFRMGLSEKGEPGYWETMHPSYTIFHNKTKTFSSIWTLYDREFKVFYDNCIQDIETYKSATAFMPKANEPANIFSISSIPWINFSSFDLNVYSDGAYLAPIFTLGKYTEQGNTVTMPLAIQLHHAACDGYHAGQFVQALQDMADDCESWL